jgi:hypothetical protein
VVEQGLKGKGKPQSRSTAASSSWRTAAEQNDEVIVSDDEGGKRSMGSQERKALEWRLQGGQGGGTVVERGLQGKGQPQSRGTAASLSWRTASEQNDVDIVSDDEGGQRSMGSQERCQGAVAEVKKIDKSPQMVDKSFINKSTQTDWEDAGANVSTSDEEEVLAVLRSAKGQAGDGRCDPTRPTTRRQAQQHSSMKVKTEFVDQASTSTSSTSKWMQHCDLMRGRLPPGHNRMAREHRSRGAMLLLPRGHTLPSEHILMPCTIIFDVSANHSYRSRCDAYRSRGDSYRSRGDASFKCLIRRFN